MLLTIKQYDTRSTPPLSTAAAVVHLAGGINSCVRVLVLILKCYTEYQYLWVRTYCDRFTSSCCVILTAKKCAQRASMLRTVIQQYQVPGMSYSSAYLVRRLCDVLFVSLLVPGTRTWHIQTACSSSAGPLTRSLKTVNRAHRLLFLFWARESTLSYVALP